MQSQQIEQVVQKLQALTPNRVEEVEDFIDFLSQRDIDRQLTKAAATVSESRLKTLWDNPYDAEYDKQ
ncbi:MAG: toxin-antitoxin system, antitoxin component, Xre family protein [Gammaproteobacteria bacterium]|nr:toxin-antitoxin system, antitoxin component, Xre family protein [Gammaproteobacteria bacterium]MDE0511794.1 toxin-antitoxin system, antitoxin component, Xre family protein [Gammaproteobacteria bacterium]